MSISRLILVMSSALLLPACAQGDGKSSKAGTAEVEFGADVKVGRGAVTREVLADGTLHSPSSAPLTIQRIRWYWDYNISWTAEEGALVKAGDPVVKLDPSTIQKDLTDREIELERAKLELEEERLRTEDENADARSAVTQAEFDVKREQLLLTDSDAVSETEKRRQRLKVEGAKAGLRRAQEKVAASIVRGQKRLEMQKIKVQKVDEDVAEMRRGLDKTELKAPQDGLVIFPLFSGNAGWQKARPGVGVQVNTVVAEIANPKDLVGRIYVPEIDAEGLAPGTPGVMTLDIAPGKEFPGKVQTIAGVPSTGAERDGNKTPKPADNLRQFEVLFVPEAMPPEAMPGMTVRVTLRALERPDVLRVPAGALADQPPKAPGEKPKPQKPGQQGSGSGPDTPAVVETAFVYAQGQGEKTTAGGWAWREVKLGAQSVNFAEVLEGLSEGDLVKPVLW